MKKILITGGAGFIGSNFIPYFLERYPEYSIVNIDALTYAGSNDNLDDVKGNSRHEFVRGDICDRAVVDPLFDRHRFNGVIHFAAESHVDNSIVGPEKFIQTNVFGTFQLLEAARRHWAGSSGTTNKGTEQRFVHISTDEVYGSLGPVGLFTEETAYAPNSPYSASKAGSDLLVRSYHHTYGLNVVTTNCSNNYGPKQHDEKLIPTIIRNALAGKPIPIYGDGKNIRDWLYVLDHCIGVDEVFHKGRSGETYNIGGRNEYTNNEIATTICDVLDRIHPRTDGASYGELITYVQDRAGHDRRYAIDATKIGNELSWKPKEVFRTGIEKTIHWYVRKYAK